MPDESAPGERVTLLTISFPPEDIENDPAVGGYKTGRFRCASYSARGYWRPRYRQASLRKPLRPVVLRPHLSAGLPLNSPYTMRRMPLFCKEVSWPGGGSPLQPIRSSVSACSTPSGVPHITTTSPSLNRG